VQQAAELSVAAPTITSSLDGRYMSALKDQRVAASKVFGDLGLKAPAAAAGVDKQQLIADVRAALYCSKICSYAQGMNIIKAKSEEKAWGVDLGGLARIWKVRLLFLCCYCH
jgi:6-phosphogluconate dehydrogenase